MGDLFSAISGDTLLGVCGNDRHDLAILDELPLAVLEGEEREVAAAADVGAGMDLGAALADDDRAGLEGLAIVGLDAEKLRVRVAAVTG